MKQIVALNDQNSSWTKILAGDLHVSILILLLVWIYLNDLSDNQIFVLLFSNDNDFQTFSQKYLCVIFQINIWEYLKDVLTKLNKTIQILLPRTTLASIHKVYIWPHLDYVDVLNDQTFHKSFREKLKSTRYKSCLISIGAIRGMSKEKIYQDFGMETLRVWRWCRRRCLFIRSSEMNILNISPAWFLPDSCYTWLEI